MPNSETELQFKQRSLSPHEPVIDRNRSPDLMALANPLESYTLFLQQLVSQLGERSPILVGDIDTWVLDAIRQVAGASTVSVWRWDSRGWEVQQTNRSPQLDYLEAAEVPEAIVSLLLNEATGNSAFGRDYHGAFCRYEGVDAEGRHLVQLAVALPLTAPRHQLMMISGLPIDSPLTEEVSGRMITSLYKAVQTLAPTHVALIEATILDDLRRIYGYVPLSLYERRFALFRDRLSQMVVYFEPVLRLDPDYLYIDSWEALARNPENDAAPVDLFEAAEMWGSHFMIELDAYFVRQATKSYRNACQSAVLGRRREDIREISVNVYPQSLVRQAYYEAVEQVIRDKLIQPEKLILEISEKFPLLHPDATSPDQSMEVFRRELGKYVRDLKIGFAIDDFGVGHASVSRLTGLTPAHVKIDRNLLHQDRDLTEITLRFVLDLASSKHLRAPKVVVEGFDSRSPVSLRQLYQLGIRYVQGYIIGKAGPELRRLGKDRYDYLKQLINDDGQNG